jgi:hypothetical protein
MKDSVATEPVSQPHLRVQLDAPSCCHVGSLNKRRVHRKPCVCEFSIRRTQGGIARCHRSDDELAEEEQHRALHGGGKCLQFVKFWAKRSQSNDPALVLVPLVNETWLKL